MEELCGCGSLCPKSLGLCNCDKLGYTTPELNEQMEEELKGYSVFFKEIKNKILYKDPIEIHRAVFDIWDNMSQEKKQEYKIKEMTLKERKGKIQIKEK